MMPSRHTIDATGQPLGRLAVQVAVLLRGKNRPDFQPNKLSEAQVNIFNTDKIKLTGRKIEQKNYFRHSGYLGGLKTTSLNKLMERDSREVVWRAVYGMLPDNRLRPKMMRNLKIYKGEIKK